MWERGGGSSGGGPAKTATELAKPAEVDQVLLRDPKDGSARTYVQIRDLYASDRIDVAGMN